MPDFLLPRLIRLLREYGTTPLMNYLFERGDFGELRSLLKVLVKRSSISYKALWYRHDFTTFLRKTAGLCGSLKPCRWLNDSWIPRGTLRWHKSNENLMETFLRWSKYWIKKTLSEDENKKEEDDNSDTNGKSDDEENKSDDENQDQEERED